MLENMTLREIQILQRRLERLDPPPILHRYRGANDYALKEISNCEVHVTNVTEMNDPFEYQAPISISLADLRSRMYSFCREKGMDDLASRAEANAVDEEKREMLLSGISGIGAKSGLICCSINPLSIRMWSYYAQSHQGICIGYRTNLSPFCLAMGVVYEDPTQSLDILSALEADATLFGDHVSLRKGKEWEFEQEYRIPIGPFPPDHTRLLPIEPRSIQEIRLGVNIKPAFRQLVLEAVRGLPHRPKVIQMGCDTNRFKLTESEYDL